MPREYEDIKQISSESTNHNFLGEFCTPVKLKRLIQLFNFKFQSISILRNSGQETISMPKMVFKNQTGPLFLEFNRCKKGFSF